MPVEVFIHRTIELGTWLLDAKVGGYGCVAEDGAYVMEWALQLGLARRGKRATHGLRVLLAWLLTGLLGCMWRRRSWTPGRRWPWACRCQVRQPGGSFLLSCSWCIGLL